MVADSRAKVSPRVTVSPTELRDALDEAAVGLLSSEFIAVESARTIVACD